MMAKSGASWGDKMGILGFIEWFSGGILWIFGDDVIDRFLFHLLMC